jgi:hypothetical protein
VNRRGFLTAVVAVVAAPVVAQAEDDPYADPYADLLLSEIPRRPLLAPRGHRYPRRGRPGAAARDQDIRQMADDIEAMREVQERQYILDQACTPEQIATMPADIGPVYTSGLMPLNCGGGSWRARALGARRRPVAARRRWYQW